MSVSLDDRGRRALEAVVEMLADPRAPTSVTDRDRAWRVHVADSLAGLEFDELLAADAIADVGSGGGFPGIAIAVALPDARVDLIESSSRKCEFMRRALERGAIANAEVVCDRAETWAVEGSPGREAYGAVTARALGRLSTIAELGSPLLRTGGAIVAWKGRRDADEEDELRRAAPGLAVEPVEIRKVEPFPGSRNRHIHLLRKNGPTPSDLPRRPGMAKKRPFGAGDSSQQANVRGRIE